MTETATGVKPLFRIASYLFYELAAFYFICPDGVNALKQITGTRHRVAEGIKS